MHVSLMRHLIDALTGCLSAAGSYGVAAPGPIHRVLLIESDTSDEMRRFILLWQSSYSYFLANSSMRFNKNLFHIARKRVKKNISAALSVEPLSATMNSIALLPSS